MQAVKSLSSISLIIVGVLLAIIVSVPALASNLTWLLTNRYAEQQNTPSPPLDVYNVALKVDDHRLSARRSLLTLLVKDGQTEYVEDLVGGSSVMKRTLMLWGDKTFLHTSSPEQAADWYNLAYQYQLNTTSDHYLLSQRYFHHEIHDFESAISMLSQLSNSVPDNRDILRSLGYAYKDNGNENESIEAFEKASQLSTGNSSLSEIFYELGRHYRVSQSDPDKARQAYETALEIDDFVEERRGRFASASHLGLVVLDIAEENWEQAYERCELFLSQANGHYWSNVTCALIYNRLGFHDKAIASGQTAIATNAQAPQAYIQLAVAQEAAGQHMQALATAKAGLKIEPSNPLLLSIKKRLTK